MQHWVEFPEIKRKVLCSIVGSFGASLGCHSASISGINISCGLAPENVQTMDESDPVKLTEYKDPWGYHRNNLKKILHPEEIKNIQKAMYISNKSGMVRSSKVTPEVREEIYKTIVKAVDYRQMIFMSDVVNHGSKERGPGTCSGLCVADFVNWLKEKKIGHITESPVTQNAQHRSSGNYSLVQGWIWLPENALERTLPGTGALYGNEKLPKLAKWRERVRKDLRLRKGADVDASVFLDGKNLSRLSRK